MPGIPLFNGLYLLPASDGCAKCRYVHGCAGYTHSEPRSLQASRTAGSCWTASCQVCPSTCRHLGSCASSTIMTQSFACSITENTRRRESKTRKHAALSTSILTAIGENKVWASNFGLLNTCCFQPSRTNQDPSLRFLPHLQCSGLTKCTRKTEMNILGFCHESCCRCFAPNSPHAMHNPKQQGHT